MPEGARQFAAQAVTSGVAAAAGVEARPGARLLVSVRNAAEARQAIEGGCDVLDVKDPSRGPLGMAAVDVIDSIAQVRSQLCERLPLTVALGELYEWTSVRRVPEFPAQIAAFKVGTSRLAKADWAASLLALRARFESNRSRPGDWLIFPASSSDASPAGKAEQIMFREKCACPRDSGRDRLRFANARAESATPVSVGWVVVAYADWRSAEGPSPESVLQFAARFGWGLLIDTFSKARGSLFDHLSAAELVGLRAIAREQGVPFATAGRLSIDDCRRLCEISPDVVGIRSAACRLGCRENQVDAAAVRAFKAALFAANS